MGCHVGVHTLPTSCRCAPRGTSTGGLPSRGAPGAPGVPGVPGARVGLQALGPRRGWTMMTILDSLLGCSPGMDGDGLNGRLRGAPRRLSTPDRHHGGGCACATWVAVGPDLACCPRCLARHGSACIHTCMPAPTSLHAHCIGPQKFARRPTRRLALPRARQTALKAPNAYGGSEKAAATTCTARNPRLVLRP